MRGALGIAAAAAMLAVGGAGVPIVRREEPKRPDEIPDRVSIAPDNANYFPWYREIGVYFNGNKTHEVVEFCQSEGWVRLCLRDGRGKLKRDRHQQPLMTGRISGKVEPYWLNQANEKAAVIPAVADLPRREKPEISREQARRLRQKAAREAKLAARG